MMEFDHLLDVLRMLDSSKTSASCRPRSSDRSSPCSPECPQSRPRAGNGIGIGIGIGVTGTLPRFRAYRLRRDMATGKCAPPEITRQPRA